MKISTRIRYGTRAILELVSHYGEAPVELKEIAKKEKISLKYLEQVFIPLRTGGLVRSVRGSKGGYSLAKHPSQICLKDVIEILDGPINLVDCLSDPKACEKVTTCVMRNIWQEVNEAIDKIFHSITLEEMVHRKMEREGKIPLVYQI